MTKIDSLRTDIRKAEKLRREIELRAEEATTGQLISECLFDVFKFSKKPMKIFDKFLPQNVKSGQIIKYRYYNTLSSPYNHII